MSEEAQEVQPSEGNDGETAAEQEQRLAEEGSGEVAHPGGEQPTEAEQPAPGSIPAESGE